MDPHHRKVRFIILLKDIIGPTLQLKLCGGDALNHQLEFTTLKDTVQLKNVLCVGGEAKFSKCGSLCLKHHTLSNGSTICQQTPGPNN